MIFTQIADRTTNTIILIVENDCDAWDMHLMLEQAFPTNETSLFRRYIVCAGGYENAIEFTPNKY